MIRTRSKWAEFVLLGVVTILGGQANVGGNRVAAGEARVEPIPVADSDWPWWRGPRRDGTADPNQSPPLKWSATENVIWKTPIAGRGHASATVVGNAVYIPTADTETQIQAVVCLDRATGAVRWRTEVHRGSFDTKGNAKTSLASSSAACDGQRVYVNFLNGGRVYATALALDGKLLWQTKVTEFVIHQGFGASPALYGPLVLIGADNKGTGVLAGLERSTGKIVWQRERPKVPNYTSPIVLPIAGRDQLLFTGCDLVTSLNPLTGETIWEVAGATTECVTSTVTDGKRIFTSGGYPRNHLSAIFADGSGKLAWENGARVYVPSMVVRDGYLYGVLDAGIATCWKCDTGEEVWKERLGGTFSASNVLVGDLVFATNEAGRTFIFKAQPSQFERVAENQLGDETFATLTICGSRIYARTAMQVDGQRQEFVYCLGKSSSAR